MGLLSVSFTHHETMKVCKKRKDRIWYFSTWCHIMTMESCRLLGGVRWLCFEQLVTIWIVWSNTGLGKISVCLADKKLHKMHFERNKEQPVLYLRPVCWEFLERWACTSLWNRDGRVILLSDLDTKEFNKEEDYFLRALEEKEILKKTHWEPVFFSIFRTSKSYDISEYS